jgi:hypothetical protein
MQDNSIDIQGNMANLGKTKLKINQTDNGRRKFKEEVGTLGTSKHS